MSKKIDNAIIWISLLYLIIPIIIFCFGYLKIYLAIATSIVLVALSFKVYKEIPKKNILIFNKKSMIFWMIAIIVVCIWVALSGIGGLCFQNDDFWARNAILRDLSTHNWPVIFDLSIEPDYLQAYTGSEKVAFMYYFTYWMPVALLTKIFNLSEAAKNVFLYLYSFLGILLVIYNINKYRNKNSYIVLVLLILFSGMDIIPYYITNHILPITEHIEWWANMYFQFSSNSTLLFWVFNQAIPIWLIVILILELDDEKHAPSLCAISFAYSPWATLGIVPIVLYGIIKNKLIKKSLNIYNLLACLLMMLLFISFYMTNSGGDTSFSLIFNQFPNETKKLLIFYVSFVFIEFLTYFLLIFNKEKTRKYFYVVLCELLVFPLIYTENCNFCMRASIPALFILMLYIVDYLENVNKNIIRKILLVGTLLIGSYTPFTEIYRSIYNTTTNHNYIIRDEVYTFENNHYHGANWEESITIIRDQFFAYDYQNSFFFKYLAR